ncbi:MAG: polysaccharide deacetylase family protein [Limnochordia bacterium]|jgi:peptidoglycan/xylan/chitin deacetylase (PgdA/CDA1 family)|nr:polysaccharide deacetylase family protein [Limnochordia bacterium]
MAYKLLLQLLASYSLFLFMAIASSSVFHYLNVTAPTGRMQKWIHYAWPPVIGVVAILGLANYYVYIGFGTQQDLYRRGNDSFMAVSFTFDDGPSPIYTEAILDVLNQYGITATFFLVGTHAEHFPETVGRILAEGHELGNHTYSHIMVPQVSARMLRDQIERTNRVIQEITGELPKYIRPPRGLYDRRLKALAQEYEQPIVLWSLSAQDWRPKATASSIAARVLSKVSPGDIILFHDSGALFRNTGASRQATVDALPLIIEGLHEKGFRILPLPQLLFPHDALPPSTE